MNAMRLQIELFSPAEVLAAEPQLRGRLHSHILPALDCVVCGQGLQQQASHLAVIMNHSIRVATVGAVCVKCGEGMPREKIERLVERAVRLMFAPEMGHA